MQHEQSTSAKRNIPRKRDGRLTLRESSPRYAPQTKSLEYLGKTQGFGTDLESVKWDDFVAQALIEAEGEIPEELRGYTRSGATLDRLYEAISRYDVEPTFLDYSSELRTALHLAYDAFHIPGGVYPKGTSEVRFEGTASAGWTWLGMKKREVFLAAQEESKKLSKFIRQGRLNKSSLPPCVCFKRTQLALVTRPKVRSVWGYPFEITLMEGKYAQPLIDAYSKRESPMFIGRSMLKELPMFMDGIFQYGAGCGLDWSGFDAVHGRIIIHEAFKILCSNIWMTDEEKKEVEVLEDYFVNTPIVMPDGGVFLKHIGIPSGSFFTQLVGSVINFIVITTLMLREWKGVWTRIKVLSDDGVFTVPVKNEGGTLMDLEKWASEAKRLFGLTLNLKKTFIAMRPEDLEFLGHSSTQGSILRDENKLLRLALYPEYKVQTPAKSLSRVRGILLDSGFKSWYLMELYEFMLELYGPEIESDNSKYQRYVIQRELPDGHVRMSKLWTLS